MSISETTIGLYVRSYAHPAFLMIFFENDDELYSRELYVFGGGVDIDGADDENIPSTVEPSYFYENVDDFDAEANAKTCIPVINYDNKTVTFDFR